MPHSITPGIDRACPDYHVPSILNQFEATSRTDSAIPFGQLRAFSAVPIGGHNRLLDNAARLFSILNQSEWYRKSVQLSLLHSELKQEMAVFQQRAEHDYADCPDILEFIPIAVYWLSVALDQVIAAQPWANEGRWQSFQIALAVVEEPILPEYFAIILERLMNEQDLYIDALEFVYVCLNLGFSSPCFIKNAYFTREQIPFLLETLHQRITAVRHQTSVFPDVKEPVSSVEHLQKRSRHKKQVAIFSSIAVVLACQFVFYQFKQDVFTSKVQLASLESYDLSSDQISVRMKV